MIFLKHNKQVVLHRLSVLAREGAGFLNGVSKSTSDQLRPEFCAKFETWFRKSVAEIADLVEEGSATMSFEHSYFEHRFEVFADGRQASGVGRRVSLRSHVEVPLTALRALVSEVENAPEDSDALRDIDEQREDFQLAVHRQLATHSNMLEEMRKLSKWTYDQVETLFLKLVSEELKPGIRRVLERHGPRAVTLGAKLLTSDPT